MSLCLGSAVAVAAAARYARFRAGASGAQTYPDACLVKSSDSLEPTVSSSPAAARSARSALVWVGQPFASSPRATCRLGVAAPGRCSGQQGASAGGGSGSMRAIWVCSVRHETAAGTPGRREVRESQARWINIRICPDRGVWERPSVMQASASHQSDRPEDP